jgi:tol-pal system protein YbgF
MKRMAASMAVTATLLVGSTSAFAASKEQQLLMAELRIMQQQQQQLQQMILGLAENLKTVTGRLDDQAATNRKALADQRLLIDNMADTVRALREKADDTNVRLSSISQELESLRQTVASQPQPAPVAPSVGEPTNDPAANPATPTSPPATAVPPPGVSPQRTFDTAYSDYTGGQYELAVVGFETFLKFFPRDSRADDAQLYIGNALYNAGKYREAIAAYLRVISDYPKGDTVAQAYYKLGLTYNQTGQKDLARKAFETVLQNYPTAIDYVPLAKQQLDRLK